MTKEQLRQSLIKRNETIVAEMTRMIEACERGEDGKPRARTQAEDDTYNALKIERSINLMKIENLSFDTQAGNDVLSRSEQFDEVTKQAVMSRKQVGAVLQRDAAIQNMATGTDIIPVTIGDIIQPLEKGLILDKIGAKLQTGLSGSYVLPVVADGEGEILGENVELTDANIDISALQPSPKRAGTAVNLSNSVALHTRGVMLSIIQAQLPLRLQRILNRWMFSAGINTTLTTLGCKGCFDGNGSNFTDVMDGTTKAKLTASFAANTPTYAELIDLMGAVYQNLIEEDGTACFVMDAFMFNKLKTVSKDAGSGRFIVENNQIDGIPVFRTQFMTDLTTPATPVNRVGFGVFTNELLGQFGDINFIIDPYTKAGTNVTRFVVNTEFSMTAMRPQAFIVGKKSA